MTQIGPNISRHGLKKHGINNTGKQYWNLTTSALYQMALANGEAELSHGGALVCRTGVHTGRSANDKFIAREANNEAEFDWGRVNKPIEPEEFDAVLKMHLAHYEGKDLYVQDLWAGADKDHRLAVRVVTEQAWHNLFARNMFIIPTAEEQTNFEPQFTILQAPSLEVPENTPGLRSSTYILASFERRLVVIGGTSYAGEIKKSVFSVLNYLLPARDVLPMHCSVNVGKDGNAAIFFGLSGTGKTTLSADPNRQLVGDDEHGWGENGLFNFEGGCYAKVINLSAEAEPEIYATTRRFGTVLENVVMDPDTRRLDLDDNRYTENTRASYPIDFIPNILESGISGHPRTVVMLTADAFGVLPPLSKLTPEQAMYHFLSGYTAKVAGTEKGVGSEPQATFSTCFGAPFMPRHPTVYGNMLRARIAEHDTDCWLVNTGWTGGIYGVGYRMPIQHTRALLSAALEGELRDVPFRQDENFGLLVPKLCPGVPSEILDPRGTWADSAAYDAHAQDLVARFRDNFAQYEGHVDDGIKAAAPKAA